MKIALYILIPICFLVGCKQAQESVETPIKSVKTITITENSKSNSRQISGVVASANQSDLSFRVAGRVANVDVNVGDKVVKAQRLASLDQKEYKLAVQKAQAELASVRAEFLEKKDALKRQTNLKKKDYVPQAAVEQAQAGFSAAKSKVDVAQTALENSQIDLENSILKAPFSGVIAARDIEPFAEIAAGNVAFKLQRDNGLVVKVLMPETLIRDVKHGEPVNVSFPTIKGTYINGFVSEIGAQVVSGNAYPIKIALVKTDADVRSGMTAKVRFNFGESEETAVYLIPVSALDVRIPVESKKSVKSAAPVFLLKNGKAQKHMVTIRDIRGNAFEVVDGLQAGDVLIVAGVPFLTDGQAVKQWKQHYNQPAVIAQ